MTLSNPKPVAKVKLPVHGGEIGVCSMSPLRRVSLGPVLHELSTGVQNEEKILELTRLMHEIAVEHCRDEDGNPIFDGPEDAKFVGFGFEDFNVIIEAAMHGDEDKVSRQKRAERKVKNSKPSRNGKRRGV